MDLLGAGFPEEIGDFFPVSLGGKNQNAETVIGKARVIIGGKAQPRQPAVNEQPEKRKEDSEQNQKFKADDHKRDPGDNRLTADDELPLEDRIDRQSEPGEEAEKASAEGKIADRAGLSFKTSLISSLARRGKDRKVQAGPFQGLQGPHKIIEIGKNPHQRPLGHWSLSPIHGLSLCRREGSTSSLTSAMDKVGRNLENKKKRKKNMLKAPNRIPYSTQVGPG